MHYTFDTFRILLNRPSFANWEENLRFVLMQVETDRLLMPDANWINRKPGQGPPIQSQFTLTREDAQRLADSLYEQGVRPSAAAGSAGAMAAVQEHLKDMRRLVFQEKAES